MNKSLAAALSLLLAASPAFAVEWQAMGPRALGMGGAGVATAQGPLASYWNPAALGRATENAYGLAVPFGVHGAVTGTVLEGANNLKNLKDSGSAPTQAQIDDALNKFDDKNDGLRLNANVGGDFKVGKVAFFLNGFADLGAFPVVDKVNNSAADISNGVNKSKFVLKGANVTEFGVGYGHELPFAPGVFLGGDLKLMSAEVGYTDYFILQNDDKQDDFLSKMKNGARKSSNFGVDAGALWDVQRTFDGAWWRPRVGLTGRNLNNPKFKLPDAAIAAGYVGKYSVNPQVRLGGAISPLNWWHIASDVDLTNNLTAIDSVSSRQFGVGTELDVFNRTWINIPLRLGLTRNLANAGAGTMLTAGTGINLLHLIIDLSGEVSPKNVQSQSQGKDEKIPREFGAAVQLSLLFGGSDDRARKTEEKPVPPAPAAPAAAPAAAPSAAQGQTLKPSEIDAVKKNSDKAQKEMSKESETGK